MYNSISERIAQAIMDGASVLSHGDVSYTNLPKGQTTGTEHQKRTYARHAADRIAHLPVIDRTVDANKRFE